MASGHQWAKGKQLYVHHSCLFFSFTITATNNNHQYQHDQNIIIITVFYCFNYSTVLISTYKFYFWFSSLLCWGGSEQVSVWCFIVIWALKHHTAKLILNLKTPLSLSLWHWHWRPLKASCTLSWSMWIPGGYKDQVWVLDSNVYARCWTSSCNKGVSRIWVSFTHSSLKWAFRRPLEAVWILGMILVCLLELSYLCSSLLQVR